MLVQGLNNLVTHSDKKTDKDILMLVIRSLVLLKCLKSSGYFPKTSPSDGELSHDELLIARLLYHLQSGIGYNYHGETCIVCDHCV